LHTKQAAAVAEVRQLRQYVTEVAHIIGGAGISAAEQSSARLGELLDEWRGELARRLGGGELTLSAEGAAALRHLLGVLERWRPYLLRCYDVGGLPKTNNEMEDFIRRIKRRYRRMVGRKNWNRYLLRYGARVAYIEGAAAQGTEYGVGELGAVSGAAWQAARATQRNRQREQLGRWRFRRDPAAYLADLEQRWEANADT
jgi:hypothetical protein